MKKYLLVIAIFFCFVKAQSQAWQYHPMPDSNAVWRVDWWTHSQCNPPAIYSSRQDTIGGDTTIGIYSYKKIYSSGMFSLCGANPPFYSQGYLGALRQDITNKKVYFRCSGNFSNDTLLYDFSLNIGDTLKSYINCGVRDGIFIISSIDSVLVGGNYHKRFNDNNTNVSIIEGVGSTTGLIEPFVGFEDLYYLICFSHDTDVYPSTSSSCPLVTNTVGFSELPFINNTMTIEPNPFSFEAEVALNDNSDIIKDIYVYNSEGILVKNGLNVLSDKYRLRKNEFNSGLYIIKVVTKDNKLFMKKFIVE